MFLFPKGFNDHNAGVCFLRGSFQVQDSGDGSVLWADSYALGCVLYRGFWPVVQRLFYLLGRNTSFCEYHSPLHIYSFCGSQDAYQGFCSIVRSPICIGRLTLGPCENGTWTISRFYCMLLFRTLGLCHDDQITKDFLLGILQVNRLFQVFMCLSKIG